MHYSSNLFNYSKHLGMIVGRLGVLKHAAHGFDVFEQVLDETADLGLTVVSTDTGEEANFFVGHIDKDADGVTVKSWLLKPTLETQIRLPQLKTCKILVVA